MKAMGKSPLSSLVMALINIGWYGVAVGLALAACLAVASLFINFIILLCGLIVLAIAEVFREGMRLDEEQSLTV